MPDKVVTIRKTITDNLFDKNMDNQNIVAFESLGGATVTYKTFWELVEVYAKSFCEIGIKDGEIVTICAAGTLDVILDFLALNKIGAVAQFVNPNYFKYNSKKYIDDIGCKTMICLDRFYPLIRNEIGMTSIKQLIISSMADYMSTVYKIVIRKHKIKSADVIDDYVSIKTLHLLSHKKPGVHVILFTENGFGRGRDRLTASEISDFSNEYPTIQIKPNPDCHDRFIVLDYDAKTEKTFHCGASSKDGGNKVCCIYAIESTILLHPVINKLLQNPDKIL